MTSFDEALQRYPISDFFLLKQRGVYGYLDRVGDVTKKSVGFSATELHDGSCRCTRRQIPFPDV